MKEKTLYWLDGELIGEGTEDEVEGIIRIAEASGYALHQRPGHILMYVAGEGNNDSQEQQDEALED